MDFHTTMARLCWTLSAVEGAGDAAIGLAVLMPSIPEA